MSAAGNSRRHTIKEGSAGPDPLDIERIRADWRIRGFSCDLWVDPTGRRWENFVHRKAGTVSLFPVLGFAGEESKLSPLFDLEGRMEFEIEGAVRLQNTT